MLQKLLQQEKQIESLNLIVEELRRMVFGKKKAKDNGNNNGSDTDTAPQDGQTKKRKMADNNKAERGLRHIVLKRKASCGSKTQKGADTMSILCSTLLSCWWSKPENFFTAYEQMLNPR